MRLGSLDHQPLSSMRLALLVATVVAVGGLPADSDLTMPSLCRYDVFEKRNRANCSGRQLFEAAVVMWTSVELLDLSDNRISRIQDNCFQPYHYLIGVNLSRNAIESVYLQAFQGLRSVAVIDLSFNRLSQLDHRVFETNRQLKVLHLEGNKFMSSPTSGPFLSSLSLQTLNLRNAQVSHLTVQMFAALPELQDLDLANNQLIVIDPEILRANRHLRSVNLSGNQWKCDDDDSAQLLAKSLITDAAFMLLIDQCPIIVEVHRSRDTVSPLGPKLERMEVAKAMSSEVTGAEEDVHSENITITGWHLFDDNADEANNPDDKDLCSQQREHLCSRHRQHCQKSDEPERECYTRIDRIFQFTVGLATGIVVCIFILICALCFACGSKKKKQPVRPVDNTIEVRHQTQPQERPRFQRTITATARNHQARPTPPRPTYGQVVRFNSHSRDNFVTRLFGLPSRNQFSRGFNENSAILIRQLSRTNLVPRRLSQYFTDVRTNRATDGNADGDTDRDRDRDTDLTRDRERERDRDQNRNRTRDRDRDRYRDRDRNYEADLLISPEIEQDRPYRKSTGTIRSEAERTAAQAKAVVCRPETPPPNYGDIVR